MLVDQINQETTQALRDGASDKLAVMRLIKTSLKNEEIKQGHELADGEAMAVLIKEAKQRRDSIAAYEGAGRGDLAAAESAELDIIQTYLPKQLNPDELKALVSEAITDAGPNPQMGAIIGAVKAKAGPSADGSEIAKLVRENLS
ncbi:MAG TPA: GatB/YqeY domain-containing protein [Candidatus Saccharimonadales bacterium]|nr:GatB/YqeY domain-containing protein [Candidatus Saccharimonadales bacterium]